MIIGTGIANPNIAIIKYWGNRDDKLLIPANNSLSFTMDDKLKTKTTVIFDEMFGIDELWINDEKSNAKETMRVSGFLDIFRKIKKIKYRAKVFSQNSFPKSAGLASSASAFAALSVACNEALELKLGKKELSSIARFGSGSASRSVFGGAVEWLAGAKKDGTDCYSREIAPKEKFAELVNVVGIVEGKEKKVGSREGMLITKKTSKLYGKRIIEVKKRFLDARKNVIDFDFQKLAPIIMEESDNLHAVMADSKPSLIYLNDTSKRIIGGIKNLNKENEKYIGAYTFDAGPNAHIYTLKKYSNEIVSLLKEMKVDDIRKCEMGGCARADLNHLM